MRPNDQDSRRRGIVLLMVLGILALLSVVAVTFVQLSNLEKAISRNYLDRTRAALLADSGVEYAISRILATGGTFSRNELLDMIFNNGDYSAAIDDPLATPSYPSLTDPAYSVIFGGTLTPDGDRVRLKIADESGKLNLNDSNGKWNWDDDAERDSDHPLYSTASPSYDPDDSADEAVQYGRLGIIVEELCDLLFGPGRGAAVAIQLFDPLIPGARPTLPGDKFSTMDQVQSLLIDSGVLTPDEFTLLQQHVTLWSWQDPNVIRPTFKLDLRGNNYRTLAASPVPNPSRYPGDANGSTDWFGFNVYSFRDFQSRWFQLEPRCPINVNTAGVELLQSLIGAQDGSWGVNGWFLREGPGERLSQGRYGAWLGCDATFTNQDEFIPTGNNGAGGYGWIRIGKNNALGMARWSPLVGDPAGLAKAIHDRIHNPATGKPFTTWEEFEHFLREEINPALIMPLAGYSNYFDNVAEGRAPVIDNAGSMGGWGADAIVTDTPPFGSDDFRINWGSGDAAERWWIDLMYDVQVDALLANFNPNTDSNEYVPNRSNRRRVDKNHLIVYTAELSFGPTGVFSIESQGAIYDEGDHVVARGGVHTLAEVFLPLRHTTQAQFMGRDSLDVADIADLDVALSEFGNFVQPDATTYNTAGAGLIPGHRGFTTQTYPEPLLSANAFNDTHATVTVTEPLPAQDTIHFSRFDGSVMLATQQQTFAGAGSQVTMEHHFNGSLLKDFPSGPGYYYQFGSLDWLPTYRNRVTVDRLMHEQWQAGGTVPKYPGSLYPDGAYSEAGRTLSIPLTSIGSADGSIGSLSFWVKPNYDPAITSRIHSMFKLRGKSDIVSTGAGAGYIRLALPTANKGGRNREFIHTTFPAGLTLTAATNEQFAMYYFCHDYPSDGYALFEGPYAIPDPNPIWVGNPSNYNVPHPMEPTSPGVAPYPRGERISADTMKWGWEDESLKNFPTPIFGLWTDPKVETLHLAKPGWVPNRCFAAGWGGMREPATTSGALLQAVFGRWTNTANHDYPDHIPHSKDVEHNFEGYAWNHVAMSWDVGKYSEYQDQIYLDGEKELIDEAFGGGLGKGITYDGKPSLTFFAQSSQLKISMPNTLPMLGEDEIGPPHPAQKMNVSINGAAINNSDLDLKTPNPLNPPEYFEGNYGCHAGAHPSNLKLVVNTLEPDHYLRFGDVVWNRNAKQPQLNPYSCDAVIDEVIATNTMETSAVLSSVYAFGRYYAKSMDQSVFTSGPIHPHDELGLSRQDILKLVGVRWNTTWPRFNRAGNTPAANVPGINVNPYFDSSAWPKDPMSDLWNDGAAAGKNWDPISVDFSVAPGNASTPYVPYFWWTDAALASGKLLKDAKKAMPAFAGGTALLELAKECENAAGYTSGYITHSQITSGDLFQYRIYFNYDDRALIPFYESPVFEDITFIFARQRPKILSWRVVAGTE